MDAGVGRSGRYPAPRIMALPVSTKAIPPASEYPEMQFHRKSNPSEVASPLDRQRPCETPRARMSPLAVFRPEVMVPEHCPPAQGGPHRSAQPLPLGRGDPPVPAPAPLRRARRAHAGWVGGCARFVRVPWRRRLALLMGGGSASCGNPFLAAWRAAWRRPEIPPPCYRGISAIQCARPLAGTGGSKLWTESTRAPAPAPLLPPACRHRAGLCLAGGHCSLPGAQVPGRHRAHPLPAARLLRRRAAAGHPGGAPLR